MSDTTTDQVTESQVDATSVDAGQEGPPEEQPLNPNMRLFTLRVASNKEDRVHDALPFSWQRMIDGAGYGDFRVLQQRVSEFTEEALVIAGRSALSIGGSA